MKISEAFDAYRINFIEIKNQSERTIEMHELCKKHLLRHIGDIEISNLTLEMVVLWRRELLNKIQLNSLRGYILKLRVVLKYCENNGIEAIKSEAIPVPKRLPKLPEFLSKDEVAKMINSSNLIRTKFVISLLYSSGIRVSELVNLNIDDIRDRRFSIIGKGGKPRLCFIDERTEFYMRQYIDLREDDCLALLVSNYNPHRLKRSDIELIVGNAAKKAGLKRRVTPHTIRHSFATDFLKNNGNMRYLSVIMGHSSMDTTAVYAHVIDNDLEEQYRKYHKI